jgi:hypothetical protein
MVLDGLAGLRDLGGSRPPPPSPPPLASVFTMPPGAESEEQERQREAAEDAHRAANPRSTACPCGCMRWESGRGIDGGLAWLCANCRQRYVPRDRNVAVVRPSPPAPPPPAPLPSPAEARQALERAVEARESARSAHGKVSSDAGLAARNASDAQARVEASEAALTLARVTAREDATRALQAGRAPSALDLSKPRLEVEKAADGLLAAKEARDQIDGQLEDARRELARTAAKVDEAALTTLGVEIGPPAVQRVTTLAAELVTELARLGWLEQHRALPWTPDVQGLLALRGLAPRDWPMTEKLVAESDGALGRTVIALASDPSTEIPAK